MAKRQLHRFRVPGVNLFRNRQADKLVIRPTTDTNASTTTIPRSRQTVETLQATSPPAEIDTPSKVNQIVRYRRRRLSGWWLLWLSVLLVFGGTSVISLLWLTTPPPSADCKHISPLATDSDRLYCAQLAAESGNFDKLVAAMKVVEDWPDNHPLYNEAQRMMGKWSQDMLSLAQQKVNQGDLKAAIGIVSKIPVNSPLYPQTQATLKIWEQEWQQGEKISSQFQKAIKSQNWQLAWQQLETLLALNSNYWRSSKHDQLTLQLATERQGWQQLKEARDLAESKIPENLEQAIALAGQVGSTTYAWTEAKADRKQWSYALVKIAADLFNSQKYSDVVAVAQRVPTDVSVYAEAQDWIRLSRATDVAQKNHVLGYLDALSGVRQINQQSPLHQKANAQESLWKSQLQDQIQLQFARAVASLDQRIALQLAVAQAQEITSQRPGRIEAQTQIAIWRKGIEQIKDRSTLTSAKQLAEAGTMESLNTAVTQASQVKIGQPLRIEAQTLIAQWTKQIQIVEDQPILDMARAFSQNGDLNAAVKTAQQIRPERALYADAQTAVNDWVTQIQSTEDRPILDAATALAAQGRLQSAIQTAGQVRSGRALYPEAQKAITSWQSQLDIILAPPQTSSNGSSTNSQDDNETDVRPRRRRRASSQRNSNNSEEQ